LTHPGLWRELAVVRYTNVLVFALAMAACLFFTAGLAAARRVSGEHSAAALPDTVLHLLGLALLTLSMGRELPIAAPRADTLLLALLLFAGGLLLRLLGHNTYRLWQFPALGLVLGCAYLTKSFAFLPSAVLILFFFLFALLGTPERRTSTLAGTVLSAVVFGCVAGPYILAISHQLGHFTTGESARLNYAFFIDMTPRWHEWFHHDLGHAGGTFLHPEAALATNPPVYSYAAHPYGSFPLWFDPAWWTLGLKPHVWLKGHVYRLLRNLVVFFRYLLGRPEIFVLLAVALRFGAALLRRKEVPSAQVQRTSWTAFLLQDLWYFAPIAWGLLMLAIYFPIDLQDRYLTGPLLLVVLPLFAGLRVTDSGKVPTDDTVRTSWIVHTATALAVLFAGINLSQAATYLADRRRHIPPAEQHHPGFDPQIFTAAAALDRLGAGPGGKIACMGDLACYTDHYWARLAGVQILGEVETPGEANPITVWNSIPDKRTVTAPLAKMGLSYIVSLFPNSASKPEGWIELGHSNFFAYPLQRAVSPQDAAAVAEDQPAP
ncbi:MAG TPA: hypothetical protein VKV02_02270, partial [Acidobacteriaceae bacterium]|nr:hypothetical protein [Acidobacteriaceae bacterium]